MIRRICRFFLRGEIAKLQKEVENLNGEIFTLKAKNSEIIKDCDEFFQAVNQAVSQNFKIICVAKNKLNHKFLVQLIQNGKDEFSLHLRGKRYKTNSLVLPPPIIKFQAN